VQPHLSNTIGYGLVTGSALLAGAGGNIAVSQHAYFLAEQASWSLAAMPELEKKSLQAGRPRARNRRAKNEQFSERKHLNNILKHSKLSS
jgi:hypothetical protein